MLVMHHGWQEGVSGQRVCGRHKKGGQTASNALMTTPQVCPVLPPILCQPSEHLRPLT